MNLTPEEQLTVKTYNTNAKVWAQKHATPGYWAADWLIYFVKVIK